MNVVDRRKYVGSILIVFATGALLKLALDQHVWREATSWATLLNFIYCIHLDKRGLSQIWGFVASGGTLAGTYVWLFEKYIWKLPLLQGWFVRFPDLSGTWVGILEPRTKAMQSDISAKLGASQTTEGKSPSANSRIPEWARNKRILPVRVTIEHEFDRLTFTAFHPNSRNVTLAQQLVFVNASKETRLYVVYANEPDDGTHVNAAVHEGCCDLELINAEGTKSATSKWRFHGKYWTDKRRGDLATDDRGTWGFYNVWWESKEKCLIDWQEEARFDRRSGTRSQTPSRHDSSASAAN